MPRMGGREACERMLAMQPTVKVIFSTAYGSEAVGMESLERCGLRFLQKPAAGTTLLAAVREMLDANATAGAPA